MDLLTVLEVKDSTLIIVFYEGSRKGRMLKII